MTKYTRNKEDTDKERISEFIFEVIVMGLNPFHSWFPQVAILMPGFPDLYLWQQFQYLAGCYDKMPVGTSSLNLKIAPCKIRLKSKWKFNEIWIQISSSLKQKQTKDKEIKLLFFSIELWNVNKPRVI